MQAITNSRKKCFNFIRFLEMRGKMPKISASRTDTGGDSGGKIWSNQLMC
jgi:hypothetical protein